MIVVADTSPFVVLVACGHVDILPVLFKHVSIPPQVSAELAASRRPQEVRDFDAHPTRASAFQDHLEIGLRNRRVGLRRRLGLPGEAAADEAVSPGPRPGCTLSRGSVTYES